MSPAAFGNASYSPQTEDGKGPDFFRSVKGKNITYVWNRDNSEFSTILSCCQAMELFILVKAIITVPMVM